MHAVLGERFDQALVYAHAAHQNQWRKKTHAPYIAHPLGVAALVLEYGGNEDEAIAGLLHDSVEDAGGQERLEDIRQRFGDPVADIVAALSDWIEGRDGPRGAKAPWRRRKEAYLERMREAGYSVLLVSAADKLDNAQAIARDYYELGDEVFERFTTGAEGTRWYYRAIIEVLEGRVPERLLHELRQAVGAFTGSWVS